ncbi:hypothetical protein CPB84DRAFT_1763900 [Gymnopilus junonius]|uniref:DUF7918 domain-containing protein n=1 Tax=Gymnopilus junonius TaxID=109634 RepID=A0A9P5TTZ1_GYMJU|nr:hypothetical protein CPB84DRAFT_1763900 [Gymnopilus junonius]
MTKTLLSFREHDIWVTVDGKQVEHYNVSVNEKSNQIQCWIPSEDDKPFAVKVKKTTSTFHTGLKFFVDGRFSGSYPRLKSTCNKVGSMSYFRVSEREVRDFKFGHLETTDDDTYLNGPNSLDNIGEIKIVCDIIDLTPTVDLTRKITKSSSSEFTKVHERSGKALNHRVGFAEKRRKETKATYEYTHGSELATFTFKYRPLNILQAMGIAPRPAESYQQEISCSTSLTPMSTQQENLSTEPEIEGVTWYRQTPASTSYAAGKHKGDRNQKSIVIKQESIKQEFDIKQEFGVKQEFDIKQELDLTQGFNEFDIKQEYDIEVKREEVGMVAGEKRSGEAAMVSNSKRSTKKVKREQTQNRFIFSEIIDLT